MTSSSKKLIWLFVYKFQVILRHHAKSQQLTHLDTIWKILVQGTMGKIFQTYKDMF